MNIYFGPFQIDNRVILVSKKYPNSVVGTITAQGGLSNQKLAISASKEVNDKVEVFNINNDKWVIRTMCALENWKLMGFKEEGYWKLKEAGFSDNKIKFLAGNSIAVNVLENLFKGIGIG